MLDHLNQVKLGERWLVYSQPYGAVIERSGPASTLRRDGWTFDSAGTVPVDGASPASMIDGDLTTRWTSGVAQSTKLSLTIDLGRAQTFTEISLDSGSSIGDYLRRYRVQVSDDGDDWRNVARGPGHTGEMIIALPPTTARYVRLISEAESGSWWSIHELNLRNTQPRVATEPPGEGLVTDSADLPGAGPVVGYYNGGPGRAVVPWPVAGFDYTYRLPPTAAVTFAVLAQEPRPVGVGSSKALRIPWKEAGTS